MSTYYKATRADGTDFYTGTVNYAKALATGKRVRVSTPARKSYACCTSDVLHASDVPTETLIGGSWPCRLFEVTGRPVAQEGHKRGFRSLAVVREIDAHLALGPQGREVAALVDRAGRLTTAEADSLTAAGYAAWDAARNAARDAAGYAAWDAAWNAARDAARYAAVDAAGYAAVNAAGNAAWWAAWALVVRDLIGTHGFTQAHYDALTGPWRQTIGPIHPDDEQIGEQA